MTEKSFGCLGIVGGDGKLAGILTDGDLRRNMGPELLGRTAGEIMTRGPKTITAGTLASAALQIINASKITALFVVDGDGVPPASSTSTTSCGRALRSGGTLSPRGTRGEGGRELEARAGGRLLPQDLRFAFRDRLEIALPDRDCRGLLLCVTGAGQN